MTSSIIRYEWKFDVGGRSDADRDLMIEMECIKRGGSWVEKGKTRGAGLLHHYKQVWKMLWPEQDMNRWTELILKSYCEERITAVMGCSDSSKTFTMSKIAVSDYFIFPDETLWMVSTTEGRGAELRVWGKIKNLFDSARNNFPWLPGNPLDHLKTITTGKIDKDGFKTRQLDKGIIVIPCKSGGTASGLSAYIGIKAPRLRHLGDEVQCFPAGTLVDTPDGSIPIEQLKNGDNVFSAAGIDEVVATMSQRVCELVEINLSDGNKIICTPKHPILTVKGWKNASHINQHSVIVRTYEAMSIMRGGISSNKQREGVPNVQAKDAVRKVPSMWASISKSKNREWAEILHKILWSEASNARPGLSEEILHAGTHAKNNEVSQEILCQESRSLQRHGGESIEEFQKILAVVDAQRKVQEIPDIGRSFEGDRPQAKVSWGKWNWNDGGRETTFENVSNGGVELPNQNRNEKWKWFSDLLQGGLGFCGIKTRGRSGRKLSPDDFKAGAGCEKDQVPFGIRVVGCKVLKQEDIKSAFGGSGGITVYNLSVKKHPSYSVAGILVHNCMNESFLNAYNNWIGGWNFKSIMAGNFFETDDPLGIATEPDGGWDSFVDTVKTQTWRGKFYDAHVIALDGRDSPNFDFQDHETHPRYKYLKTQRALNDVSKTHGTSSWQWYSQCVGKPAKGMDIWRVITKDFCELHHASEDVIWGNQDPIKLYALDPAYGLGDNCVGRLLEMGMDSTGKQIVYVHPGEVLDIDINSPVQAEDQIAHKVSIRLAELGVPPEHCFYDSFGRGTLGFSFAKIYGMKCPVPVDSGALPTKRPVRYDLFVVDDIDGSRRLKRCDEHYKKFVTEMWFSTNEAIHAEQIRGLDALTIREGVRRRFRKENNFIIIETKAEFKKRTQGRSPDFYDNFAIGIEGARRLGFKIDRLGENVINKTKTKPDWLDEAAAEYGQMMDRNRLAERV